MNIANTSTSVCRLCRFYQTEGRRGGTCQKFDVQVKAEWESCSLFNPPFTDKSLPSLERILHLESSLALPDSPDDKSEPALEPAPITGSGADFYK